MGTKDTNTICAREATLAVERDINEPWSFTCSAWGLGLCTPASMVSRFSLSPSISSVIRYNFESIGSNRQDQQYESLKTA